MERTERGFQIFRFVDHYGYECSIQQSSLAELDCIWLGISNPTVKMMAKNHPEIPSDGTGWVDVPLPTDASISSRMHLSKEQVKMLLPILKTFLKTGELE